MSALDVQKYRTLQRSIETCVELLRTEWREGLTGEFARQAGVLLRNAMYLSPDQPTSFQLAGIETRIEEYQAWSADERRQKLPEIANDLKRLHRSVRTSDPPPGRKQASRPTRSQQTKRERQCSLSDPVTVLPRVGDGVARKLQKLGISSVGDVLRFTPRRHIDYSKTLPIRSAMMNPADQDITIRGRVSDVTPFSGPPARVTIKLTDETGAIRITWFNPYISKQIRPGDSIAVSGTLDRGFNAPSMTGPEWEKLDGAGLSTGRLTPVYPLTQGVAQKTLRNVTRAALDATVRTTEEYLPDHVLHDQDLLDIRQAYDQVHYPHDDGQLKRARYRLAFDDLYLLQLGLLKFKEQRQSRPGIPMTLDGGEIDRFKRILPFRLTGGQESALVEVLSDLQHPTPMTRLLQGDVGSGKTVVAAAAALTAIANHYQAAVMAPTEILAEQHAMSFDRLYADLPDADRPTTALLTGSTKKRDRSAILEKVASGDINLLIGTHALIQDGVDFQKLGLAITDEQHRFGVRQRAELSVAEHQAQPHVLSMTATPIPRTLSMILSGDLDVSVIDELPAGRVPIETIRYAHGDRTDAYRLVRREIESGRQAFVIRPLVEESDSIVARAAVAEAERLQKDVFSRPPCSGPSWANEREGKGSHHGVVSPERIRYPGFDVRGRSGNRYSQREHHDD